MPTWGLGSGAGMRATSRDASCATGALEGVGGAETAKTAVWTSNARVGGTWQVIVRGSRSAGHASEAWQSLVQWIPSIIKATQYS